jgi:hypothetical protein
MGQGLIGTRKLMHEVFFVAARLSQLSGER